MSSFFIDLENVRSYGLEGILLLKPDDKVYVFYSDNANTLTIPTIESLNESSAQVKYIKTNYIGANAMDFQIVTLLGASIEKEKKGSFYIISHDNGFKSAVKFCDGYFTGYDIVTGVFANILLAINSEKNRHSTQPKQTDLKGQIDKKNSGNKKENKNQRKKTDSDNKDKNSAKDKNITQIENNDVVSDIDESDNNTGINNISQISEEHENDQKPAGRHSRRGRGRKDNSQTKKTTTVVQSSDDIENEPVVEDNPVEMTDVQLKNENGKNRNRNRRRKKSFEKNTDKASVPEIEVPKNEDIENIKRDTKKKEKIKSGNYQYVYNALSDFLSKSTIEMYAAKIDEGIKKSSNKNELHQFFKKNYGPDEAEALYKIIHSDFDKMKKEAGK